jgi:hypothetical protein
LLASEARSPARHHVNEVPPSHWLHLSSANSGRWHTRAVIKAARCSSI